MEDGKFLVAIWRTVAAVFAVFVLTVGGCTVHKNRAIAEMVERGADPLRAVCAFESSERDVRCAILATK
jgi:hypothetical protein